jgi:hypothetical protein
MEITSHESVLAALEDRASWFSHRGKVQGVDDTLVSWALDKTGTVDTSPLCRNHDNSEQLVLTEQQERSRVMGAGVPEEVLRVHGIAPSGKLEGVVRLIYENINGVNNRLYNNDKVEKAKEIHDELEVNIVAYNEH